MQRFTQNSIVHKSELNWGPCEQRFMIGERRTLIVNVEKHALYMSAVPL